MSSSAQGIVAIPGGERTQCGNEPHVHRARFGCVRGEALVRLCVPGAMRLLLGPMGH